LSGGGFLALALFQPSPFVFLLSSAFSPFDVSSNYLEFSSRVTVFFLAMFISARFVVCEHKHLSKKKKVVFQHNHKVREQAATTTAKVIIPTKHLQPAIHKTMNVKQNMN
jgi:hypothetical protein